MQCGPRTHPQHLAPLQPERCQPAGQQHQLADKSGRVFDHGHALDLTPPIPAARHRRAFVASSDGDVHQRIPERIIKRERVRDRDGLVMTCLASSATLDRCPASSLAW
jgi:hypothetical protein